jgi:hypothetical protein
MSQARSDTGTLRAYSVRLVRSSQTALWRTRARCRPLTETLLIGLPEHLTSRRPHHMKTTAGQTLDRFVRVGVSVFRQIVRNSALDRLRYPWASVKKCRHAGFALWAMDAASVSFLQEVHRRLIDHSGRLHRRFEVFAAR